MSQAEPDLRDPVGRRRRLPKRALPVLPVPRGFFILGLWSYFLRRMPALPRRTFHA
jgi:hypothetical protein